MPSSRCYSEDSSVYPAVGPHHRALDQQCRGRPTVVRALLCDPVTHGRGVPRRIDRRSPFGRRERLRSQRLPCGCCHRGVEGLAPTDDDAACGARFFSGRPATTHPHAQPRPARGDSLGHGDFLTNPPHLIRERVGACNGSAIHACDLCVSLTRRPRDRCPESLYEFVST